MPRGSAELWAAVRRVAPIAALPILLWLCGSLLLAGDLGKNSDDYALNLRDPVTERVPHGTWTLAPYSYFFRPLHLAITFFVGTYFPHADQAVHVAQALLHAGVALALCLLSRRAARSWIAPVCAVLVFLTLPVHAEAVFWFSTIGVILGMLAYAYLAHLVLRFAAAPPGSLRVRAPLVIAAVTLIVGALFEQALAACFALPLLCFASRAAPSPIRVRRALVAALACAGAAAVYATLLLTTSPAGTRGGSGSFITLGQMLSRARDLLAAISDAAAGPGAREFVAGSWVNAVPVLGSPVGVVVGAGIAAAVVTMLVVALRDAAPSLTVAHERARQPDLRPLWTAACVLLGAVLAWAPVLVVRDQIVQHRMFYVPAALLTVAIAIGIDRVLSAISIATLRRLATVLFVSTTFGLSTLGAWSQVGSQVAHQHRALLDIKTLAALVESVPSPPHGALFVPMRLADRVAHTGFDRFDHTPIGVMDTAWSSTAALRRLYRRADITALGSARWSVPPFEHTDALAAGIRVQHTRTLARTPIPAQISWERVVPFEVTADGTVRLARTLIIERADGSDLRVRTAVPPRSARSDHPGARAFIARTADDALPPGDAPLDAWTWTATGASVAFESQHIWHPARLCTWMHPAGATGDRRAMHVDLPPSQHPRRIIARVTIAEHDLRRTDATRPVLVRIAIDADPAPLASIELAPPLIARTRGWLALIADLPPAPSSQRVTISVEPGPIAPTATDPAAARVLPIMLARPILIGPPPEPLAR